MKKIEFVEIKLKSVRKLNEYLQAEISDLKEKNRVLQRKLDNATKTIMCLNKIIKDKQQ